MKKLILVFLFLINLSLWFVEINSIYNDYFIIPLFSIVISTFLVFPKFSSGFVRIKIIHFIFVGILYFNTPIYFIALFDKSLALSILSDIRIGSYYFIKSNILLGISLPLISLGHLIKFKKNKSSNTGFHPYKSGLVKIKPFILLSLVFIFLSISYTGFTVGSTFVGTSSYYYILMFRSVILLVAAFYYNRYIIKNFSNFIRPYRYKKLNITILFIVLLFIAYVLVGGDRGPVLTLILMFVFGFLILNKMKIRYKVFTGFLVLAISVGIVFKFVEVLRHNSSGIITLEAVAKSKKIYDKSEQKAGVTVRTTSLAIKGIEEGIYPHTYGLFFSQYLIKGIPFIGNYLIEELIGNNMRFIDGSANLLTIQYHGDNYDYGIGTSFLADTFIEFGLIGVILLSLLYGAIIRYFDDMCFYNNILSFSTFLLISLFLGYSIYVGRATLWSFIANFIHTYIFYLVVKYIVVIFTKPFKKG